MTLSISSFITSTPLSCTLCLFFFFNDTATTEIYTLSLHDALPIFAPGNELPQPQPERRRGSGARSQHRQCRARDRKSTRLNSSHSQISYAVFCLKKKKTTLQKYSKQREVDMHQQHTVCSHIPELSG